MGLFDSVTKGLGKAVSSISGGLFDGLGGALVGGGLSYLGQSSANAMSQDSSRESMAFQERMSSSAYQRAVADLKAAGLNPALAYSNGGASSPGGAQFQASDAISTGVNSALATRRLREDIRNAVQQREVMQTQDGLNIANQTKSHSETALNKALTIKALEDAKLSSNNARTAATTARLAEAQLPAALSKEAVENTALGRALRYSDRVFESIGKALGNSGKSISR